MRWLLSIILLCSVPLQAKEKNLWHNFHHSFTTLEAELRQITDDEISTGILRIDKEHRSLRIDITAPYAQTITLYNNVITLYNKPIKSANIVAYEPNVFIELLLENADIVPTMLSEYIFQLGSIQIGFDPTTQLPRYITRYEDGEFITVEFLDISRNINLDSQIFVLNLSEDVDVMDETY